MSRATRVWDNDWRARILSRVSARGHRTISGFLSMFPGEPYMKSAGRLGDDAAAIQLETVHLAEATTLVQLREVAMDSLVRDLNQHLRDGWPPTAERHFDVAGAYADGL